jgi:dihydrofolate reductase
MRKLKLQMQTTVDGFVAGPNGELDWMTWDWDDELKDVANDLTDSSETILMGRKMTDDFVKYWTGVLKNPESPEYEFAKKMVDYPKVVFTKTLDDSVWANTTLAKGDIVEEVNRRKNQSAKDIIVYGGAGFVSSLIKENLIDEYNLFVNPVAIRKGMTIFEKLDAKLNLKLVNGKAFDCGIVLLCYEPKR